jgi:hypothetical protein
MLDNTISISEIINALGACSEKLYVSAGGSIFLEPPAFSNL